MLLLILADAPLMVLAIAELPDAAKEDADAMAEESDAGVDVRLCAAAAAEDAPDAVVEDEPDAVAAQVAD